MGASGCIHLWCVFCSLSGPQWKVSSYHVFGEEGKLVRATHMLIVKSYRCIDLLWQLTWYRAVNIAWYEPHTRFWVCARWMCNSVILDPSDCYLTVFAILQVGTLFWTSRRGSYQLQLWPSLLSVLIAIFDTAGFLVFFPYYYWYYNGNFTSGLYWVAPIIVAGGDIPPFWIQFRIIMVIRNIYCSQDPLACAGECSMEALHFGSWMGY